MTVHITINVPDDLLAEIAERSGERGPVRRTVDETVLALLYAAVRCGNSGRTLCECEGIEDLRPRPPVDPAADF